MPQSANPQESNCTILIIGDSILMDGVAANLDTRNLSSMVHWDTINADLFLNLNPDKPKLIIFELDTQGCVKLLDIIREQPGIQLLGIDRNCEQVIVLNSFHRQSHSMSDLNKIVMEITETSV